MSDRIKVKVVYHSGMERVQIPYEMGTPRGDQMLGCAAEQLSELALRICYDSMGISEDGKIRKSRPSKEAHQHIMEVGHLSVFEHYNESFVVTHRNTRELLAILHGRPGVYISHYSEPTSQITFVANIRAILEWNNWGIVPDTLLIGMQLLHLIGKSCNMIVPYWNKIPFDTIQTAHNTYVDFAKVIDFDKNFWVSLYITGSRGFTHELVRHGDFTAISQRSTRYCNENESSYVMHPLVADYLSSVSSVPAGDEAFNLIQASEKADKATYKALVPLLEKHVIARSPNTSDTHAKKQARGAARGYLGNALETELIFSANVAQWKRMLHARLSNAADAEIREVFEKVYDCFAEDKTLTPIIEGIELSPAEDKLGEVIKGGGNK